VPDAEPDLVPDVEPDLVPDVEPDLERAMSASGGRPIRATGESEVREEATRRLAAFAARLERIGLEDFRLVALAPSAAVERADTREAALQALEAAGLADIWADTERAIDAHIDRVYSGGGFRPTFVGVNWGLSTGSVGDRVAATAAVKDAALASLADGLATEGDVDTLRAPFEVIAQAHPVPHGGDALPTIDELRRLGPIGMALAVAVGVATLASVVAGLWPLAIAGALLLGVAYALGRVRGAA
jgi:hypothetical protein